VQKFLSTDLTADGLAAIKDPAAKATKDAVPVKESMGKLSEEFKSSEPFDVANRRLQVTPSSVQPLGSRKAQKRLPPEIELWHSSIHARDIPIRPHPRLPAIF